MVVPHSFGQDGLDGEQAAGDVLGSVRGDGGLLGGFAMLEVFRIQVMQVFVGVLQDGEQGALCLVVGGYLPEK